MGKIIHYGELAFDETFVFARRGSAELRFTRQERALLLFFTRRPRTLLTRQQLLAALASTGKGDISDRNVDYLVNRLRAKLGDNAREPVYIATQYGEGYLWMAERVESVPDDAFLIIGPVFGIEGLSDPSGPRMFLTRLSGACDCRTSPNQPVVLAADWRPSDPGGRQGAVLHRGRLSRARRRRARCHLTA